jgi:hypothetical protein
MKFAKAIWGESMRYFRITATIMFRILITETSWIYSEWSIVITTING